MTIITGVSTSEEFVEAINEKGASLTNESTPYDLLEAINATGGNITFQSPNESVVEAVNAEQPATGFDLIFDNHKNLGNKTIFGVLNDGISVNKESDFWTTLSVNVYGIDETKYPNVFTFDGSIHPTISMPGQPIGSTYYNYGSFHFGFSVSDTATLTAKYGSNLIGCPISFTLPAGIFKIGDEYSNEVTINEVIGTEHLPQWIDNMPKVFDLVFRSAMNTDDETISDVILVQVENSGVQVDATKSCWESESTGMYNLQNPGSITIDGKSPNKSTYIIDTNTFRISGDNIEDAITKYGPGLNGCPISISLPEGAFKIGDYSSNAVDLTKSFGTPSLPQWDDNMPAIVPFQSGDRSIVLPPSIQVSSEEAYGAVYDLVHNQHEELGGTIRAGLSTYLWSHVVIKDASTSIEVHFEAPDNPDDLGFSPSQDVCYASLGSGEDFHAVSGGSNIDVTSYLFSDYDITVDDDGSSYKYHDEIVAFLQAFLRSYDEQD